MCIDKGGAVIGGKKIKISERSEEILIFGVRGLAKMEKMVVN